MPTTRKRWITTLATAFALVASVFVPVPAQAVTLSGADFDPGRIISDAQFYGGNAMTVNEIQTFLEKKVPRCGSFRNCLSVYRQTTFTREATSIHDNGVNPLCSRYVGADAETAAQIIFKVQQACNISAKVILVTLQKEQGLITNTNPTADKLKIAMGYACPDTAPCASRYFGFYNQVYSAASQFKRYTDPASVFYQSYPLNQTSNVLYHPDFYLKIASTSRTDSVVTVTTDAPHKLRVNKRIKLQNVPVSGVNGTYQVKEVLSRQAFTVMTDDPRDYANRDHSTSNAQLVVDRCGSKRVAITNNATRALYIYTPYTPNDAALANLAGSGDACSSYGNSNFWEYYQYWFNAKTNLASDVAGLARSVTNSWGQLVDDSSCTSTANSCSFDYTNAIATWSINGGTRYASGAIAAKYKESSGVRGVLGSIAGPGESYSGGPNGNGARQKFVNGFVYQNPANDAFIVLNDVHTYYAESGGPAGSLGWPTSDATCVDGECAQNFTGGYVISDGAGAFRVLDGAIAEYLQANGGLNSPWGRPLSDAETRTFGVHGSGRIQEFERGTVYEKNGTAYLVADGLAAALADVGGVVAVGWPLAEPERTDRILSQKYSAGRVVKVGSATGVLIPTSSLRALKRAGGLSGYLGSPSRNAVRLVGKDQFAGSLQRFEGGVIVTGATGAFAMPQSVWDVYSAAKGAKGRYGWPDSRATAVGSGWTQSFQRSAITTAR
jgi:uncharacterized protein with LGFP repeats